MSQCAFCGVETQLYVNDVPECLQCCAKREADVETKPSTGPPDRARSASNSGAGIFPENLDRSR